MRKPGKVRRFLHWLRIRLVGPSLEEQRYAQLVRYLDSKGLTIKVLVESYRCSHSLWAVLARQGLVAQDQINTAPGVLEVEAGLRTRKAR